MVQPFEVWKIFLIFAVSFCNENFRQASGQILPKCVFGPSNVDYHLYNRDNRNGVIVDLNSTSIPVRPNVTTIFLVHGFISEANTSEYLNLTNILVDQFDVNVFGVDWKDGACTAGGITLTQLLSYPSAVRNTRAIGEDLSTFIIRLISDYDIKLEDINLIGHSLGAQVVGFTSRDLKIQQIGKPHHILVLDPAGPGFENNPCDERICVTDAHFVQVLHTSFVFGIHKPVGSVDFYFNGGYDQPGCPILTRVPCSHSSGIQYLIGILQSPDCTFVGKQWDRSSLSAPELDCTDDTCSIPGPLAPYLPARGTFYVDVNDVPSFCTTFS